MSRARWLMGAQPHRANGSRQPTTRAPQQPGTKRVIDRRAVKPYRHHRCTPMHQTDTTPEPPVASAHDGAIVLSHRGVNKGHAALPRWLAAGVMLSEINRDRESADGEVFQARGPVGRPASRSRPRAGVREMIAKALGASALGSNTWWLGSGACHLPCGEHLSAAISAGNPVSSRSAFRVR
jgi:hypothetical protein